MKGIKQVIEALKKAGAEVLEVNPVHDLFIDIDYGLLEETVAALGTQDEEGNVYLKEVYRSGYRSGKSLTSAELMRYSCEMYSKNLSEILNCGISDEESIKMLEKFYKDYPELNEWLNKHMQKPCGEVSVGEGVKCLPPPKESKDDDSGV